MGFVVWGMGYELLNWGEKRGRGEEGKMGKWEEGKMERGGWGMNFYLCAINNLS